MKRLSADVNEEREGFWWPEDRPHDGCGLSGCGLSGCGSCPGCGRRAPAPSALATAVDEHGALQVTTDTAICSAWDRRCALRLICLVATDGCALCLVRDTSTCAALLSLRLVRLLAVGGATLCLARSGNTRSCSSSRRFHCCGGRRAGRPAAGAQGRPEEETYWRRGGPGWRHLPPEHKTRTSAATSRRRRQQRRPATQAAPGSDRPGREGDDAPGLCRR